MPYLDERIKPYEPLALFALHLGRCRKLVRRFLRYGLKLNVGYDSF